MQYSARVHMVFNLTNMHSDKRAVHSQSFLFNTHNKQYTPFQTVLQMAIESIFLIITHLLSK